jgi:dienelactone hydrolase
MPARVLSPALLLFVLAAAASAQQPVDADKTKRDTSRGDRMIAEYFAAETAKLEENCLAEIQTLDDWNAKKGEYRRQLLEMLGLDPLPERTDLKADVTGRTEHDEIVVENIHFQSRPGLYVTGNLYLPKKIDKPLPTILYVCGHGQVKKDGVAYGAKANYQHHGAWFARNGYACLTIDTLQLGEIEGIHHGTHRYGMWWWLNRGYTPAGVEAWNCVRALDYLETRPEVDKTRFGVTGRSGGGAYSWWIAAIDERIQCAVPVAGITTLRNHVVDGTVEGHCDCMFMVNTYRWDYPLVAALVAPRPLLIANSDTDRIFPLDGVYHTFEKVRSIYRLYEPVERGVTAKVALNITAGPHKDTQELQTHAFRWFNFHLKGDDSPIDSRAPKLFEPEQLKVFQVPSKAPTSGRGDAHNNAAPPGTLTNGRGFDRQGFEGQEFGWPPDQINTEIHETFVAAALPVVPADKGAWEKMRDVWLNALREKSFRAWPQRPQVLDLKELFGHDEDGIVLVGFDLASEAGVRQRVYLAYSESLSDEMAAAKAADLLVLNVLDDAGWNEFLATVQPGFARNFPDEGLLPRDFNAYRRWTRMLKGNRWIMAYVAPRGVGVSAFDQSERKQVQNRRRFYLLGQTLDSQQVWDIRRAIQALQSPDNFTARTPLWLQAEGSMAGVALYASLFEPDIQRLDLYDLPKTHRDGPYLLNVSRYLDMPQAVAMAAERSQVVLYQEDDSGWEYPQAVAKALGWDEKQIQIRKKPAE